MTRYSSDDGEPRPPPSVSEGADRYEILLQVLEQQNEQAQEARSRTSGAGGNRGAQLKLGLAIALAALSAWLWLAPPAWVGVRGSEPRPLAEEEASLRFVMYLQAQRIKAFQQSAGRLPRELEEAGQPLPGMSYRLLSDGTYELEGVTDRVRLTYRSDTPLGEFLGPGANVIDESVIP